MKPNLRTISFVVFVEYADAFYEFYNENEEFHDEITFFDKYTYGVQVPNDDDITDEELGELYDELTEYLARFNWHLGTHYLI